MPSHRCTYTTTCVLMTKLCPEAHRNLTRYFPQRTEFSVQEFSVGPTLPGVMSIAPIPVARQLVRHFCCFLTWVLTVAGGQGCFHVTTCPLYPQALCLISRGTRAGHPPSKRSHAPYHLKTYVFSVCNNLKPESDQNPGSSDFHSIATSSIVSRILWL